MRIIAMAAGTALLSSATMAQTPAEPHQPVELVSEMWALAGVCSQYSTNFTVRNEALAAWLNAEITGHGEADAILQQHTAKLADIRSTAEEVQNMRRGNAREQLSDETAARLMTRCRRLTNDPVAGQFFLNARR